MKIRYQKITRTTDLDPYTLIKNINIVLDKPGYRITTQTGSNLKFYYNIWRFGSRVAAFSAVDGGAFDIIAESKTITLSYYLSPKSELLFVAFVIIVGTINDPNIFFGLIFIAIMFLFRLIAVKNTANEIMDDILVHRLP